MRSFVLIIFIFISAIGFSQIVSFNETTQLLNKPHGEPVLQINAGVEYWRIIDKTDSSWTKIIVPCFIRKSEIHNSSIEDNTVLFNCFQDSVGISLQKINIEKIRYAICPYIVSSEYKCADFVGYIKTEKLPESYPITELQKDPDSFSDSCIRRIYYALNTEGVSITVTEDCFMHFETLLIDNTIEFVLIKELKTTTSYYTVDTDDVKMKLSITRNFGSDHPETHEITSDSYECDFHKKTIILKESKWYDPAYYHMYSPKTFKEIMKYQNQLYELEIPDTGKIKTNRTAFIGYLINYKNNEHGFVGTITLTDGQSVLKEKTILCTSPELADKLFCCTSKMEFIPLHSEDNVVGMDQQTLILNSAIGNYNPDCFSGFRVKLFLVGGNDNISLELEFRDGDIFIVKNYKDAFELSDYNNQ